MPDKTIADVLDKSIDKLSSGAAEIANAVKQVAPHAWEVAVRQQVVEGLTSALMHLCALVIVALFARIAWGWLKPSLTEDMDSPGPVFLALGALAVTAGAVCACGPGLRDGLLMALNPEYYAAFDILGAVK